MSGTPMIILEPLAIKALDLREAGQVIRRKYGPRCHVMEEALREVGALWGIAPGDCRINDCGVFIPYETIACRTARASAEICMAESPSGLWAMDINYHTPVSGAGAAPSVWNRIAFLSRDDARMAGLHELIGIFSRKAADGPEAAEAARLLVLLENERTPQLELFRVSENCQTRCPYRVRFHKRPQPILHPRPEANAGSGRAVTVIFDNEPIKFLPASAQEHDPVMLPLHQDQASSTRVEISPAGLEMVE